MTVEKMTDEKIKIHKSEITKNIYYLNCYISELKKQKDECADETFCNDIHAKKKELYLLKERVLIKLVSEGFAGIRQMQIGKKACYCVVRVNREIAFHLPVSNELSKLMRMANENKKNGIKLCPGEQRLNNK